MTFYSCPQSYLHVLSSAKLGKLGSRLFQTVALSLLRKASLYEELKRSINFQDVEPVRVHTTLSASFIRVVVWLFLWLPNIPTFSSEA